MVHQTNLDPKERVMGSSPARSMAPPGNSLELVPA